MNADADSIVRALVELSKSSPHGDELLRDVRDLLSRHVRESEQVLDVTLITASGNEPALLIAVESLLRKKSARGLHIEQRKDASLIGGAILQIGDQQIDVSVRGALHDLESKLRASPVAS